MKTIFDFISEHKNSIAYITRSWIGSWSISLVKQGNISNRSIQSCSQLSDNDLAQVKALGFMTFDFKDKSIEEFRDISNQQETRSKLYC